MTITFIIRIFFFYNEQISPSLKSSLLSVSVICVIVCSVALLTFGTPFIFYINFLNFFLMSNVSFLILYMYTVKRISKSSTIFKTLTSTAGFALYQHEQVHFR